MPNNVPTGDLTPEALRALADGLEAFVKAEARYGNEASCDVETAEEAASALHAIAARDEALASAQPAVVDGTEYVRAIDEAMVVRHLGVFNHGDDIKKALNEIAAWDQSIGEYFAKEAQPAAVAGDALRVSADINNTGDGWVQVTLSCPSAEDVLTEEAIEAAFALVAPQVDAALERAAEVADSAVNKMNGDVKSGMAIAIARRIRALKSATPARTYTEADMAAARAEEREGIAGFLEEIWQYLPNGPLVGVLRDGVNGRGALGRTLAQLVREGGNDSYRRNNPKLSGVLAADDVASGRKGGR